MSRLGKIRVRIFIEKVLINTLSSLSRHCGEICLLLVFALSLRPFIWNNHGAFFQGAVGLYFSFFSGLFFALNKRDGKELHRGVHLAIIFFLTIGLLASFVLLSEKHIDPLSSFELFLSTYCGAMIGLVIGAVVWEDILLNRKKPDGIPLETKRPVICLPNKRDRLEVVPVLDEMPTTNGWYVVFFDSDESYMCSAVFVVGKGFAHFDHKEVSHWLKKIS